MIKSKVDPRAVAVIGLGFVGLTQSLCMAKKRFKVYAVDSSLNRVKQILSGEPPFYEPGLRTLLRKALSSQHFQCTTKVKEAVNSSRIIFITVGTPSKTDGSTDLTHVRQATARIGRALPDVGYPVVVVRSTVPPGTTQNILRPALEKNSGLKATRDFGLCMCPEFLSEGTALRDMENPRRIVIGELDKRSGDALERFFKQFNGPKPPPMLRMKPSSAEMAKYATNAFLATKISFINEVANLCEAIPGIDIADIARAMGFDERIGPKFLGAGLGYGGSCLPKDLRSLITFARKTQGGPSLLETTYKLNEAQPERAVLMAEEALGGLKNKRIAVLGFAFKPKTNDARESVSIKVIKRLLREGAKVSLYDPKALSHAHPVFATHIQYCHSATECVSGADCCIVATEWEEFKRLKPQFFTSRMRKLILVDGRRIFNPDAFRKKMTYMGVGLGTKPQT